MTTRESLRLATRGSDLARKQADAVKTELEAHRVSVELVEVSTTGDEIRDELIHRLGKTGAFVRALDEKVLAGVVDGAVHSMKDMPTESPDDLIVAGVPPRHEPGDVLVTPDGESLSELPANAVIGTGSLRRQAQLLHHRSDVRVEPIRGNVDTRVEKLFAPHRQAEHQAFRADDEVTDGEIDEWVRGLSDIERRSLERAWEKTYDAIVLAEAGLRRSGLFDQIPSVPLSPTQFVPAPGQGALAVTARDESRASEIIHDGLDDPRTRVETTVERTVLATLGGGCIAPIGVYAVIRGEYVHVAAQVFSRDGTDVISGSRDISIRDYVEGAREFATGLREQGASELIRTATTGDDEWRGGRDE